MRVPQLRFRLREMMVAVAVVGLLLALVSYRQRLRMLAARMNRKRSGSSSRFR